VRDRLPGAAPRRRGKTRVEPLRFPGSPNPRWWQIEDSTTDPARLGADRSHFATLLLIELVSRLSHEWHGFVWPNLPGSLNGLHGVTVEDAFDQHHAVSPPSLDEWSLFQITGVDEPMLLQWTNASRPLMSDRSLEEVQLSVDEETGIVWARELRTGGVERTTPEHVEDQGSAAVVDWNEQPERVYHPVRGAHDPAHPYLPAAGPTSDLNQGRFADLSGPEPDRLPLPEATMIGGGERHLIAAGVVDQRGLKLDRRWVLARTADGNPILWLRRRMLPLPVALPNLVRFDQVEIRKR
jgi:hypothetical protein